MGAGRGNRRDRHGRGLRGPLISSVHPAALTRAERFEQLVARETQELRRRHPELSEVRFGVRLVPALGPMEDLPLGRVHPATPSRKASVVLFRRPIESRAADVQEYPELIAEVLRQQIALLLGIDEDEV